MKSKTSALTWLGAIGIGAYVFATYPSQQQSSGEQARLSVAVAAEQAPSPQEEMSLAEVGLRSPPYSVKFDAPEGSGDDRRIDGQAASRMQSIRLIGPAGEPPRAAVAMVDLRPENLRQSIDFLKRTARVVETGVPYADLDRFIESSLAKLGVRETATIKSGKCNVEFKRGSEVMAWLYVCTRKGDV